MIHAILPEFSVVGHMSFPHNVECHDEESKVDKDYHHNWDDESPNEMSVWTQEASLYNKTCM